MERIERIVAALPDDYREVIRMTKVEGCDLREVAASMGRSESAVRKLMARALLRIGTVLRAPPTESP